MDFEKISSVEKLGFCKGRFTVWAPLSKKVNVLLYKDFESVKSNSNCHLIPLEKSGKEGLWQSKKVKSETKNCEYYKIQFINESETVEVCDIWAKCAAPDSLAASLCDIKKDPLSIPANFSKKYENPFGKNGRTKKSFSDAVIFEMHIRDWSRSAFKDSTGKFLDIKNNDKLMEHLKDLGITHVQILPMFDYKNTNDDCSYNWGYDPFNYNVPEGRYVSSGYTDGRSAVKEAREMIQRFHDNGIAVIMDVVYNHTKGTGKDSLYDSTIPGYFYRLKEDGTYFNGSACGDELATNHKVVRQFVIDSLKNWMLNYHVNGFRFDLMGLQETETMKEIYHELKKIDPNVLVYGEPWTGGESGVVHGCTKEVIDNCEGVACFNDNFRNAIKGAEFGGFQKGQVQGVFNDQQICIGLCGSLKKDGGFTQNQNRTINYVECHDNFTLFDKLAISYLNRVGFKGDLVKELGENGIKAVKKQDKLSAAYIFLAQGVPFINGGQEFLRTKQGDENSYISCDGINQIDFSLKTENMDVYNLYKGLIKFRKANPESFGHNQNCKASTVQSGITKYETKDFVIFFNATDYNYKITENLSPYVSMIDLTSGSIKEIPIINSQTAIISVPEKNFTIFKLK